MARVSYVEPQTAPPEVKQLYDTVFKGKPGNIQKALAHHPKMLEGFLSFYGSVSKAIPQRLFELIYIRVSLLNGCQY